MRLNYKPIGKYIRRVEHRNRDLKVTRLLGLSMTKEFRETTSNVVGTNMSVYRVISKYQFACDFMSPIRVNKLPVVLKLDDEPNLVSPAYPVFEVKDRNELDPEYLMMWFRRPEFDRYATFKCDAAIRGGYDWEALCETLIPVPSIDKQSAIVAEYNTIQNRIKLNEQLIQKLEETAQTIYREWFVDFEFPDENEKPYKSNGGEMIWCEELKKEIPKGWYYSNLDACISHTNTGGDAVQIAPIVNYNSGIKCARVGDISQGREHYEWAYTKVKDTNYNRLKLKLNDILITRTATLGLSYYIDEEIKAVCNNGLIRARANRIKIKPLFLFALLNKSDFLQFINEINAGNSTRPNMKIEYMLSYNLICPKIEIQEAYLNIFQRVYKHQKILKKEIFGLNKASELILSKMATIEN